MRQVHKNCAEWNAVAAYFTKHMPDDRILQAVQRVENPKLWNLYKAHLDAVGEGFPGQPEMWLWHGADGSLQLAHDGFKTAYSNRTFNMYGVGHYFAVDPRMANHFGCTRKVPNNSVVPCCGWCLQDEGAYSDARGALPDAALGCKFWPENRQAKASSHSCTSKNSVEVILFENHHAYPTYLLECTCPSLSDFNPYRNLKPAQTGAFNSKPDGP